MTFVSKHGRRTSTEDSYREVPLQRWRKCLATAVLLLHFCGALVLADSTMTGQKEDNAPKMPPAMVAREDTTPSRLLKVPLPKTDLISSVQQVSVAAKDCHKHNKVSLNTTMSHSTEQPKYNNTLIDRTNKNVTTARQTHFSQLLPFLTTSRNFHQCLYLDELSVEEACAKSLRNQVHLRFCAQYHLGHILPEGQKCGPNFLAQVREMDEAARLLACQFDKLLELYDCDTSYSVSWSCNACKRVYKQWVCAMVLPFHVKGELVKPCRSVCRLVEQMCPYFHPSVKEQYAGERVFKCIDPDIPDLESISPHSVFGVPGHCYCPHHLDAATVMLDSGATECELSRKEVLHVSRQSPTLARTTTTPATNFSTETSGSNSSTAVTAASNSARSSAPSSGSSGSNSITAVTAASNSTRSSPPSSGSSGSNSSTAVTAVSNSTRSSPPSSGSSSSACLCLWLLLLLMTLQTRTSGFFSSEPT